MLGLCFSWVMLSAIVSFWIPFVTNITLCLLIRKRLLFSSCRSDDVSGFHLTVDETIDTWGFFPVFLSQTNIIRHYVSIRGISSYISVCWTVTKLINPRVKAVVVRDFAVSPNNIPFRLNWLKFFCALLPFIICWWVQ